MKSSLDKIFYKVVYHHIIYMCDFLVNLDDSFAVVCTNFHEGCGFHQICFPFILRDWALSDGCNVLLSTCSVD